MLQFSRIFGKTGFHILPNVTCFSSPTVDASDSVDIHFTNF